MLHKPEVNTERLDALARTVLRCALRWERGRHEHGAAYQEPPQSVDLSNAVEQYLEALIDEQVPLAQGPTFVVSPPPGDTPDDEVPL